MKNDISFVAFICILMLSSCGSTSEYGKQPLKLDNFNFDLNIEKFFQNEDIFRGKSDYAVAVKENWIEEDSIKMGYIDYSTISMSQSRPLANYADVQFEKLGIITDWEDKEVIMAYASTDYAKTKDVESILNNMKKEFGTPEIIPLELADEGLNLKFFDGSKVATLSLVIPYETSEEDESNSFNEDSDMPEKKYLTNEIDAEIKKSIKDLKEIKCNIFITTANFDKALQESTSFSGDLTYYR